MLDFFGVSIIVIIKYITTMILVMGVFMAPAFLARINKKNQYNMLIVRVSSWLLGWTGIGWLFALYIAVRK